jgi:hypothetical protein
MMRQKRQNLLPIFEFVRLLGLVLLHSLAFQSDRRPAYAWMKAKIERIMPKIFEKYAGPDVLALLEKADETTIQKFEKVILSGRLKEKFSTLSWLRLDLNQQRFRLV